MSPLIWARRGQQASYIYNWLIIPVKVDVQTLRGENVKNKPVFMQGSVTQRITFACECDSAVQNLTTPAMSVNTETISRECKPLAAFSSFFQLSALDNIFQQASEGPSCVYTVSVSKGWRPSHLQLQRVGCRNEFSCIPQTFSKPLSTNSFFFFIIRAISCYNWFSVIVHIGVNAKILIWLIWVRMAFLETHALFKVSGKWISVRN